MSDATTGATHVSFYDAKKGIMSWVWTTDHKRIGLLYLWTVLSFFLIGMTLGFLMRLEMLTPGKTIVDAQTYNSFFTLHGIIMVFLVIIPSIPGVFGNFFLPIQIGAEDVAFPRLNMLSYYLYITGGLLALGSVIFGNGIIDTGWTFYVPYSLRTGTDVVLPLIAAFILGFSSILTGLNFVTTMHRMRAPGMKMFQMPLFCWGLYSTAWMQILATPIIGVTVMLVVMERVFHFGIFDPSLGGDPVLYQHLFWIYSHPAVYIMIIPAMGVISDVIATFSKRTVFGYTAMVISTVGIAFVGNLVWAHHMFTSGMSDEARAVFSFFSFLVGVPTGVKIFNWVATLYKGSIDLKTPMLYAMSFIFIFMIGGFTGIVLGALSADIHLHDTYFVVGHFHYVMFGGSIFMFFAALHYWFPKMFNRMYNEKIARICVLLLFVGFNTLYFPMLILGLKGMPRRYYDYLPEFQTYHVVATVGSWILVSGILLMVTNLLIALKKGKRPGDNPWGAPTLEWTHTQTPPVLLNFDKIPYVDNDPYIFPDAEEGKAH